MPVPGLHKACCDSLSSIIQGRGRWGEGGGGAGERRRGGAASTSRTHPLYASTSQRLCVYAWLHKRFAHTRFFAHALTSIVARFFKKQEKKGGKRNADSSRSRRRREPLCARLTGRITRCTKTAASCLSQPPPGWLSDGFSQNLVQTASR